MTVTATCYRVAMNDPFCIVCGDKMTFAEYRDGVRVTELGWTVHPDCSTPEAVGVTQEGEALAAAVADDYQREEEQQYEDQERAQRKALRDDDDVRRLYARVIQLEKRVAKLEGR